MHALIFMCELFAGQEYQTILWFDLGNVLES